MQAISVSSLPQQVIMPAFILFDAYQAVRLEVAKYAMFQFWMRRTA